MRCFFSALRTADFVYRRVPNVAESTARNRIKTRVPRSVICQRKLNRESGSLDGRVSPLSTRYIIAIPLAGLASERSGSGVPRRLGFYLAEIKRTGNVPIPADVFGGMRGGVGCLYEFTGILQRPTSIRAPRLLVESIAPRGDLPYLSPVF